MVAYCNVSISTSVCSALFVVIGSYFNESCCVSLKAIVFQALLEKHVEKTGSDRNPQKHGNYRYSYK